MFTATYDQIKAVYQKKGYPFLENTGKEFNLNLIGIRNPDQKADTFNDTEYMVWEYKGTKNAIGFPITTDPGVFYRNNPAAMAGTGILKEGFHKDLWQIAKHQGKYSALCQRTPTWVIRDFDKDADLDFNQPDLTKLTKKELTLGGYKTYEWYDASNKLVWREQYGLFGVNNHRAAENGASTKVYNWSAACQVLQNRLRDFFGTKLYEFDYFMSICNKASKNCGPNFSYALTNEKDFA